jgi:hypothetical protein
VEEGDVNGITETDTIAETDTKDLRRDGDVVVTHQAV